MLHKVLRIDDPLSSRIALYCMYDANMDATVTISDGETILLKLSTVRARCLGSLLANQKNKERQCRQPKSREKQSGVPYQQGLN